jgi:hypothetical protein
MAKEICLSFSYIGEENIGSLLKMGGFPPAISGLRVTME